MRRARAPRSSTAARTATAPAASLDGATLDVEIPAGIHDGQRIRVSGEGHAGALGGRAGDVYVRVRVRPDPRFVREGNDIFSQVDLTVVQAALGATCASRRSTARSSSSSSRARSPATSACCVDAACRCCRASAAATIACSSTSLVPRRLTDEQRRLLEEFDAASDEDTYRHDEGFFEKLKSAFR